MAHSCDVNVKPHIVSILVRTRSFTVLFAEFLISLSLAGVSEVDGLGRLKACTAVQSAPTRLKKQHILLMSPAYNDKIQNLLVGSIATADMGPP